MFFFASFRELLVQVKVPSMQGHSILKLQATLHAHPAQPSELAG